MVLKAVCHPKKFSESCLGQENLTVFHIPAFNKDEHSKKPIKEEGIMRMFSVKKFHD
jgi:hypothetical protein